MKAVIILCCIVLAKATRWGYSFGSGSFPHGFGPLGGHGAGFGGFDHGGTTVIAGPTSIGFGRGHAVSTPKGTISTAVGKGIGTAPHNAGQVVQIGPITSVTSPLGSDHPTDGFFNGHGPFNLDYGKGYGGYGFGPHGGGFGFGKGYGFGPYEGGSGFGGGYGLGGGYGGYSSGFGGHGPWRGHSFGFGGHGFGASRDVVGAGTSAAISARGNAEANAVGSRVSGQISGVSSSGTGRPLWTPFGQIGVADSGSSSVTTGFGHFPHGGYSGGFGGGFGFGGNWGGIGGYYPSGKKY